MLDNGGKSTVQLNTIRMVLVSLPFLARNVIYTSRSHLSYDISVCLSVRLSVTEVQGRIIANFGFKFRSKFTAHCGRGEG